MPILLSKKINEHSAYAIWHITETEEQLLQLISETPPNGVPDKRSEWIVTRILVQYLCQSFKLTYEGVSRLPSGKPTLNNSKAEISISHSFPLAGALINLNESCGIDIEWPREKLIKVQSKYLNERENEYAGNEELLCKVWACKEVLFKVHGRKNLSLKNEIDIQLTGDNKAVGKITKPDFQQDYKIGLEPIFNYWIAYNE